MTSFVVIGAGRLGCAVWEHLSSQHSCELISARQFLDRPGLFRPQIETATFILLCHGSSVTGLLRSFRRRRILRSRLDVIDCLGRRFDLAGKCVALASSTIAFAPLPASWLARMQAEVERAFEERFEAIDHRVLRVGMLVGPRSQFSDALDDMGRRFLPVPRPARRYPIPLIETHRLGAAIGDALRAGSARAAIVSPGETPLSAIMDQSLPPGRTIESQVLFRVLCLAAGIDRSFLNVSVADIRHSQWAMFG